MINIFQPSLGDDEIALIKEIFSSNWLGKGTAVNDFESGFAQSLSSNPERFLSTTSCTEAIFLSAKLFNFSKGDEIIVPAISFPSIGSAIIESGATIVICDVDKHSLNVRAKDIQKVISDKTKAIYITHYGGIPCEMDEITKLCKQHKILVIEDSACAVRSFYKGQACGTIGDMGMWSFDAMKTLSTADGGMMYIKDPDKRIEAEERLYLGLPVKSKSGLDSSSGNTASWWEFEMNRTGRRAIMNNVTAAMGLAQLDKLSEFIEKRKNIQDIYISKLDKVGDIILPPIPEYEHTSSYYFFWIQTKYRDKLAKYLLDKGVYSTFRYWPLNKIKLFTEYVTSEFPNSDYAASHTLNIPLHQSLSDEEVNLVISSIKNFYEQF
jgi:dTDP-4-amino-4,6-dideoxygalactose transaminase